MPVVRVWDNRKGTSLVEILVVMVVLLVGIMTVVMMFPSGFRVVRAAESQTVATRLAQQELERWKNMLDNLPAGIVPIDESGLVLNNQPPGPPFEGIYEDGGRFVRGNVLNSRQVIGESTPIPVASYFQTGSGQQYGAKYTVAFSPIDVTHDGDGQLVGLVIKSGDLRRRMGDFEDAPPYLRAGEYAVDYTLVEGEVYTGRQVFHVAFPKAYGVADRLYYISYSFWATSDPGNAAVPYELSSVIDQPVEKAAGQLVPGDYGGWVEVPVENIPSGLTLTEIEGGSETCARGFREHVVNANGHQDKPWCDGEPYEFILADQIMGVIAFNPTGRGKYEYTARGMRPIEARMDYRILDPRVLREDKVIPQPGTNATRIPIKLALRFILNVGDPTDNPNEETYKGLVTTMDGSVLVSDPVLVIDLATGLRVAIGTTANDINYKAGVVNLPLKADLLDYSNAVISGNVPLAGRHLRFFYRADGDWSVQCQKAYVTYNRRYGASDVDYHSYAVEDAGEGISPRLIFAPCEGDKSVVVDYSYVTSDGAEHKVVGKSHKIEIDRTDTSGVWCINLWIPEGTYIPRDARMIVAGTSFTARVMWRDGKSWRHVDLDTNLTRN